MNEGHDFSPPEPEFEPSLHADVIVECRLAWMAGRPWSKIRALREGVDASESHPCGGSQGTFHLACPKPVEGVQYSSARGCPLFFCEEHALDQLEKDTRMYDLPPPEGPPITEETRIWIERFMARGKKRNEPEPEEDLE